MTRLVLDAHILYMNRDGGNCFVGVRRLAINTGLDKSTVAEHRALAIKLGWLMTSPVSRYSRSREVMTSVPDDLPTERSDELSGQAGQLLSGVPGRSSAALSGLTTAAVRFDRPNRPAGAGHTSYTSITYQDRRG